MIFGNVVGDSLGTPDSLVPMLNPHLLGVKEFELLAKLDKLQLIGFADHYCPDTLNLNENKTSRRLNRWTQKEVDAHGQLTMYALMLMLTHKVKPEDLTIWLNFIPVRETQCFDMEVIYQKLLPPRFRTTRTTRQCLEFGATILKTLKEMETYAYTVKPLA